MGRPDAEWQPERPRRRLTLPGFSPLLSFLVLWGPLDASYLRRGNLSLLPAVTSDLTAEERQELGNIRRRKEELLADIQVGGRAASSQDT